jgi:putative transposase
VAAFIAAQRDDHDIPHATACRALEVSPAWFYKWAHGDPSPQHARRARLGIEVARLFAKQQGRYGAPRISADLREAGERVSENTVAALMREQGLVARPKRCGKNTTRPGRSNRRAPDLIGRSFGAEQLNCKWYGDGTERVTDQGKLYLDSVLDMGSRRIVGFALGAHHDAELAYAALAMAIAVRGGKEAVAGVIFHTDAGSEGVHRRVLPHRLRSGWACASR